MQAVTIALILVLASACSVQAGAWLRSKDSGFASTSITASRKQENSTSVYLEYGLEEKLTLGADITYGIESSALPQGSGTVFLRFPLGSTDGTHKWAAHLGFGARYLMGVFIPAGEVGLSWGRGIKWGEKYGWVNVDGSYNAPQSPADARVKLDGTIGLGVSERSKIMVQMFNTSEGGQLYTKLAPSYLFSPAQGKTTYQFGAEIPVAGGGNTAIKIGIWREF